MNHEKRILAQCSLMLIAGMACHSQAAEFYTIIGPDGRPMVVQKQQSKATKQSDKNVNAPSGQRVDSRQENPPANQPSTQSSVFSELPNNQSKAPTQSKATNIKQTDSMPLNSQTDSNKGVQSNSNQQVSKQAASNASQSFEEVHPAIQPALQSTTQQNSSVQLDRPKTELDQPAKSSIHVKQNQTANEVAATAKMDSAKVIQQAQQQPSQQMEQQPSQKLAQHETTQHNPTPIVQTQKEQLKPDQTQQNITVIDDVEYVDNEYLENREFNLEGKKRFYMMPEGIVGGASRVETIEREKGISKSVFSKFLKNAPAQLPPVVLASTYYRLPKNEVEQTLEQSCFSGKKIEKAKLLSLDKDEVGLWPVPPIKEKFVYDVVKLDTPVENIHLTSYASSQKAPRYYWPLVVFLDQKGCVIEGVSGFKNQDLGSNSLQYSALEGVLKKPNNATYMFMTPLAEALDVQGVQLSNKGQIKLSVLR